METNFQTFKDFHLKDFLLEAIEELNFKEPTPIQKKVIPTIQAGGDIIGQSATGSGKSHAFLLPILDQINPNLREVQAVITTPSRELAEQLYQVASQLLEFSDQSIQIARYTGGMDKERQMESLDYAQPHLVIGTPGRILDLVESQALKIHKTRQMVIDEADMTLDLGFIEPVDRIVSAMPDQVQLLVFSATIPERLEPFLRKYLHAPQIIRLQGRSDNPLAPTIHNWLLFTRGRDRKELLYDILTMGNPYLVLIFANTIDKVNELAHFLAERDLNVGVIHGDLDSRERKRVMRQAHQLDYQFIIATDLAARGIDIEGISHVINYEIPQDLSYFVHRVGRTGRQGLEGIAITFYDPDEEESIQWLQDQGIEFEEKEFKNGEIIDRTSRQQRRERVKEKPGFEYDPEVAGLVKKAKKKVKPGYRRKIRQKRKQVNRRKNRQKKQAERRRKRR